jgi:hypothetical protein
MSVVDRRQSTRRKDGHTSKSDDNRRKSERRQGADRRDTPRVNLELWMEELSGEDVYFRRTGNVSIGGAYFDTPFPYEPGTEVTLKFGLPGSREMVVARGKVVSRGRGQDGLGMGVKFISIEGNGRDRIRSYIDKLKG